MVSTQLAIGSLVRLRQADLQDPDANALLQRWRKCYKKDKFEICWIVDRQYVALRDPKTGKVVRLGSGADPLINADFVELAD